MSSRISVHISSLPVGCTLDTYEDGSVWLRLPGGEDVTLRGYAQRVGSGPGRGDGTTIDHAATMACEECGAMVLPSTNRDFAYATYGKILCFDDTPRLERKPDNGERRRKSDALTTDLGSSTR